MIGRALRRARAELAEVGVRVTADQLYYATCRALLPPLRARRPGFLVRSPLSRAAFDRALARVPDADLVPARLPALGAATDATDVLDYGLPRLLVCQRDGVAAMLLANDLHMESGTVVLGGGQVAGGLPAPLREVGERGATTVYLLHDATAAGAGWQAATERSLDGPGRVVTLGLRPAQARLLHLVRGPAGGAELAAVPPAHLLRVLRRLLSGPRPVTGPSSVRARARVGFLSWPGEPA